MPVQARSAALVDVLHAATIQVLVDEGLTRCTTTRVAERAGVSVGSIYQYYPNRDALLAAVLERHLDGVGAAIEDACRRHRGATIDQMAAALVWAFLRAKLSEPDVSRALYAVAGERGGWDLSRRISARMTAAIAGMLASAPGGTVADAPVVASLVSSAIIGAVRAVLEGAAPPGLEARLEGELVRMVTAYLAGAVTLNG